MNEFTALTETYLVAVAAMKIARRAAIGSTDPNVMAARDASIFAWADAAVAAGVSPALWRGYTP